MKRKCFMYLLIAALMIFITSCSSNSNNNSQTSKNEPIKEETEISDLQHEMNSEITKIPETETLSKNTTLDASEKNLGDIEKYLLDKGVLSGERTQMAAQMIGGIDGFKYAESNAEIYEYDIQSDEYISLSNGEEINMQGMDNYKIGAVSTNGKFVLIGEPSQELIDCFNSFK